MQDENPVPDYLMGTYRMIKCAFPEGISEKDYWPLLAVLHEHMSFRTLARTLSALTEKVYNDHQGLKVRELRFRMWRQ